MPVYRKAQGEWESHRRRNEISEMFKTGKLPKEELDSLRKESPRLKASG
ncbi:MAG: hypothetical protein IPO31_24790 [Candidatus Obscuribacter sp.]|nr:hypothetical protein [Candidatus Obscuribacter sp.]